MERRILIIDDDRSMCDVLDAELKRRGFEVTTTTVPENALHRLVGGRLRPRADRHQHARDERRRPLPEDRPEPRRPAGRRHDRVRQHGVGDRRDPRRRLRLRHQAVRDGRHRAHDRAGPQAPRAARGGQAPATRGDRQPEVRRHPRHERGDEEDVRPRGARRRDGDDGARHRARAAPARSSSPRRSTSAARARTARSSRSTARRCPRTCSRASSSGT